MLFIITTYIIINRKNIIERFSINYYINEYYMNIFILNKFQYIEIYILIYNIIQSNIYFNRVSL